MNTINNTNKLPKKYKLICPHNSKLLQCTSFFILKSFLRHSDCSGTRQQLPNGFCPVARYTKTLPFEQDDCQMSIDFHRIFSASLKTRYKSWIYVAEVL